MEDPTLSRQDLLPSGYSSPQDSPGDPGSPGKAPPRAHRARGPAPDHPKGARRRAGTVVGALAALVVLIGGLLVWAERQIDPGQPGTPVSVSIPPGASTSRIASILARAGIIHDATLFTLYVRLHGGGPLYPGRYELPKDSSYSAAARALRRGPRIPTDRLVIPEGFTVRQIAEAVGALPGMGLSAEKFLHDATDGSVRSPYEPPGVDNLEGLLFPATYQVRQGESEVDILEEMIGAFDQHAAALGLEQAATRAGLTPYQVIIVASIVEREAKLASDRPNVASVIYNRLRAGMPLGADSTQTYYLRLSDPGLVPTPAQLDSPSPYNTRLNKGLPPTPIANPGLPSLEAAVSPPATSYLYFVEVNPDGQLGFASSSAGFVRLRQQCRAAGLC